MNTKNTCYKKLITLSVALSFSMLIASCGGGGSSSSSSSDSSTTSTNNTSNPTNTVTTPTPTNVSQLKDEPIEINATNWRLSRSLNRNAKVTTTTYSPGNHTLSVIVNDHSISENDHLQVYLNTDNDSATGYQFDNEAWANKSGADYLIEDDVLFKSTANDSTWSWKYVVPVQLIRNGDQIRVDIPVSRFSSLCNTYTIGTISMTADWDIETFYPLSNDMATKSIDYCDSLITNNKPVITLNDATSLIIELGTSFDIPLASAYDEEDGDISSNIQSVSNVNTGEAGVYEIIYSVTDSGGLAAIPVRRTVIVQEASSTFTIDGNTSDWNGISPLAQFSGSTLKITDDEDNIYILVDATNLGENTQILIDSDSNAATGTAIHGNGVDFMVENELLSKYIGSSANQWAWDYGFVNIPFTRNQNIIEMSIPKASLGNLNETINIGFKSLDSDWIINYSIPELSDFQKYDLVFDSNQEQQLVVANADTATTNNTTSITIDAVSNDTERLGYLLEITQVSNPNNGGTVVISGNKISYKPSSNFTGIEAFTYTISDGHGNNATATITVNVSETNTNVAPLALNDTASTDNISSVTINVIANDSDPDGDELTIASLSSPAKGSASILDNKVKYTPNTGSSGTDTFTYTISDGNGHSATATIMVNVTSTSINRSPVAVEDAPQTEFNTPIEINVLANDSDPDGDSLTIESFTQPPLGVVTQLNATTLLFDPQGNIASISFIYTISDGRGGTATAGVTVASNDPNDDEHADFPVITDENITINAGESILIDVLANDFDPDGDDLNLDEVDDPDHGTTVKVDGDKVRYTPDPGFTGIDVFFYGVHDGFGHNGAGKVTVTVQ